MSAYAIDDACLEHAMNAIVNDERECSEFAKTLMASHKDEIAEILTGAYGYGEEAARRFKKLLQGCERDLLDRAERNLQTRGF